MVPLRASGDSQGRDAYKGLDPLHIRSSSIATEKALVRSPSSTIHFTSPSIVSPEPAFIAASAASQIVTNDHDHQADTWFDQYGIEPSGEAAIVTLGALKLVNEFLDQLLFSFIAASKSTSLAALRPAVVDILKPKLAKDAISGADQELHDYLGTGDDEELLAFHSDTGSSADWDPDTVWKRTRLRCMVYSSLGDMEEEDEDYHVEQQQLNESPSSRYSKASFAVSPAVAIFLTSILEFMGEQALVFAGQQAFHRLRTKREKESSGPSTPIEVADRVVVEEHDMDKVALDRTLGRLWRGWRKRLRSPTAPMSSRSMSRDSFRSRDHSRSNSSCMRTPIDREARTASIFEIIDQDYAAAIPLPTSDNDVREIEIPGLAYYNDVDAPVKENEKGRPKSLLVFSPHWDNRLTPNESLPATPVFQFEKPRKRSNSLPTPLPSPITIVFPEGNEPSANSAGVADELVHGTEQDQESTEQSATDLETAKASSSVTPLEDVEQALARAPADSFAASTFLSRDANVEELTQEDHPMSKDSDVEQYFVEKPKIMTSHRVSVGAMSPDSPLSPRPTSVRSLSVHSVRLIDVPSRSPARLSHGLSENTTPIVRSPNASPFRNMSGSSSKDGRNSNESIAEAVEPDSTSAASKEVVPELRSRESDDSARSMQRAVQAPYVPTSVETRPTFVLDPAPATQRRAINGDAPTKDNLYENLPITRGDSGSVPPLTPLREMMEGAADTSDEASSIAPSNAPSNESRSLSEPRLKGHTSSISIASLGQAPQRRPVPAGSYRAKNDSLQKGTMSEAGHHSKRSASQSSSATSQSLKVKPMRTSSEYGEDSKGKSFDELIRSDETIQYTLTPQNMREIEVSPIVKKTSGASTKKDAQSPDSSRVANPPSFYNESSSGSTPPRPSTSKSYGSVSKYTGLHSNPPSESPMPKPFQPVPRPVSNTSARVRPGAPKPRDARVEQESVGDFADFIRSTGPTESSQPPPRSSPTSSGRSARTALTRNASASFSRASTVAPVRRSESSAGRTRLLAREAVVPHSDNNSDLIDFIRQGPASTSPRIPRTVAPFRTTMDSDQMAGAVGGRAFELALPDARNSQTSTNVSESMTSSVTSQSALLNGTNRNAVAPARSYNDFDEEDMMPKRKTRRVLDPYAIDFSDEEGEELFATSNKRPQQKEESLMDFLNSVPPPPSTVTSVTSEASTKSKQNVKKKPSRGLMSRFTRTTSASNIPTNPPPPSHSANGHISRVSTSSRPATSTPQTPYQSSPSARTGTAHSTASTIKPTPRPYTNPNPQHSFQPSHHQLEKPKSYQPARGNYVSQLDTERKPPSTATSGSRVVQRSYQPREARQGSEGTNDLAAFLMASVPPPSMVRDTPPEPFLLSQDSGSGSGSGSFSRMFRKKGRVV